MGELFIIEDDLLLRKS